MILVFTGRFGPARASAALAVAAVIAGWAAAQSPLVSQAAAAASRAATARVLANAAPGTRTPTLAPGTLAPGTTAPGTTAPSTLAPSTLAPSATPPASGSLKNALLAEIRKSKQVFYNMVVAQAQRIEVAGDRVTFTFAPNQRTLRDTFEQNRPWLESIGQQLAGRRLVFAAQTQSEASGPAAESADKPPDKKAALREQALADASVQTMLEMFPAEIRDVEEM